MLTDLINPRKPTEKEVKELMDYILSAREADSGFEWDETLREVESAMAEAHISGSWIAVFDNFEFKNISDSDGQVEKGRLMSCVWPGYPTWSSVFIWSDDKIIEFIRGFIIE